MKPLDQSSFEILRFLTENAQLSTKELATAAGLAPSSCHERLKQLRKSGLPRGSPADVDLQKLGIGIEAIIQVGLRRHSRSAVEVFVHLALRDTNHLREAAYPSPIVPKLKECSEEQSWPQR